MKPLNLDNIPSEERMNEIHEEVGRGERHPFTYEPIDGIWELDAPAMKALFEDYGFDSDEYLLEHEEGYDHLPEISALFDSLPGDLVYYGDGGEEDEA